MSEVRSIIDQLELCRTDASECGLEAPQEGASADARDTHAARVDRYAEALDGLAGLACGRDAIDACDASALSLQPNSEVLADLMERDPAMSVMLAKDSTLELGRVKTRSIPKQHYRRLVYLAQHALEVVLADADIDLTPNGIYDEATQDAVVEFQRRIGMPAEEGAHGAKMGPRTLSALIMRVRHDPYSIKMKFAKAQMQFMKIAPFYVHPGMRPDDRDASERAIVREAVRDAMVWMGHMDVGVDVSAPGGMHALRQALHEHIGEIDLIGPKSMRKIMARLETAHRSI